MQTQALAQDNSVEQSANDNTQNKVDKTNFNTTVTPAVEKTAPIAKTQEQEKVVDINNLIFNNRNVTSHILLDHFKGMFSNDKIVFYDKRGKKEEFDNMGVVSKRYVKVEDRNGTRNKFVVVMKTYLHLMGDVVVMEWDNSEVKYTTKINHEDLQNWSGRMYWKGTYSQSQAQLQTQKAQAITEGVAETKTTD